MRSGEQRVYFALQPPAEIAAAAQDLARDVVASRQLRGLVTPAHRLHVSLYGLGPSPAEPCIRAARQAAAQLAARPFRLAFNRLGTWGRGEGQRPIVLWGDEGVIGVEGLHEGLHRELVGSGLRRRAPGLRPHMTLLWDRMEAPLQFVPPVTWWAREFVLINSRFGESRHEILGRFPLE